MIQKIYVLLIIFLTVSCKQEVETTRGIPTRAAVESQRTLEEEHRQFMQEDHELFLYDEEESPVLMRRYYVAVYKSGVSANQVPAIDDDLKDRHLKYLNKLRSEAYINRLGPVSGDDLVKGIVLFQTPTLRMADSLARLDPLVVEEKLNVKIYPWWTAQEEEIQIFTEAL